MMPMRRDSIQMESMSPPRFSVLGPLTRSEEILQFERLRHQISMVQAMRGLQITASPYRETASYYQQPWRRLREVKFTDLVMNKVQDGCVIKCRTIVAPLLFGSVQLLVEEVAGGAKVLMLSIDNFVDAKRAMEVGTLFPVGREIWIRNPCVKSQAGRAMISVDNPAHLKLRPTIWEIERILDYGPVDAEGWKIKGNTLVERGRLQEAVDAYETGIAYAGWNQHLKSALHRKRAATLVTLGKYQAARRDAIQALAIEATDKTRLLLAKILLNLRSYSAAFEVAQQISDQEEPGFGPLMIQISTCMAENRDGVYDIIAMTEESKQFYRVAHADYVSPNVELRSGGIAGRGLFASEDVPAGTLLIASKATLCLFAHEMANHENGTEATRSFNAVREALARQLTRLVENGSCRRVLRLAGGRQSSTIDFDLRKDDVYDYDDMQFDSDEIKNIISKNSFALSPLKSSADDNPLGDVAGGGGALFYAPSFLNHSCLPIASYFRIGDMMFVKACRAIEQGEELTVHYLSVEGSNEKERNETLEESWGFTCQCGLCKYERENEETCEAADKIVRKALEYAKTATTDEAIKKLLSAKKKLYELYKTPMPQIDVSSVHDPPPPTPPATLAHSLVPVLKEMTRLLRDGPRDESLNVTVNGGYYFLLKSYSHFDRIGAAAEAALRVWEYLYRDEDVAADEDTTAAWLMEAKETHNKLLGKGYFEHQYGKYVEAVQSDS